MAQRVLITGAAGFLGSHLTDALLIAGHEVIGLDDLSSGRKENLTMAMASSRFSYVHHDVRYPLPRYEVDRIYHLASPASPPRYQARPVFTTLTNVLGTTHACQLAEDVGARLLLASTSEVYGEPEVHPQPESYSGNVDTQGVRACYDEGKRTAEALVADFTRRGMNGRIARIFNTYGPRLLPEDGRVVSSFLHAAREGAPLPLHGDGSQTRSFCYVDDLVRGLRSLMEADAVPGPVNLGNDEEVSVYQLAMAVLEVSGSKGGVAKGPRPAGDPTRRCPDLSRANKVLGYEPSIPLAEGLTRTWKAR